MTTGKLQGNKPKAKRVKPHKAKDTSGKQPHAAPETGGPVNFYDDESRKTDEHKGKANVTLVAPPPD